MSSSEKLITEYAIQLDVTLSQSQPFMLQLFINYKLKSVAHLPWRMMTYKVEI